MSGNINININPEEMIFYGNAVKQNGIDFLTEVASSYQIIDDLSSAWTGTSASRYTDNVKKFKKDFEDFGDLINKYGELLVAIGKNYTQLEEKF